MFPPHCLLHVVNVSGCVHASFPYYRRGLNFSMDITSNFAEFCLNLKQIRPTVSATYIHYSFSTEQYSLHPEDLFICVHLIWRGWWGRAEERGLLHLQFDTNGRKNPFSGNQYNHVFIPLLVILPHPYIVDQKIALIVGEIRQSAL